MGIILRAIINLVLSAIILGVLVYISIAFPDGWKYSVGILAALFIGMPITYFILRSKRKESFENLPNLFFSPLLGFKYDDNRIPVSSYEDLIERICAFNLMISEFVENYDSKNQHDLNEYRLTEMRSAFDSKREKRINVLDFFNPGSLIDKSAHNLKVNLSDIGRNLGKSGTQLNRLFNSERHIFLEYIAIYIRTLKYMYLQSQFMLKNIYQATLISNNIDEFIANLEVLGNPLAKFLLETYRYEGEFGVLHVIREINKTMYGVCKPGGLYNGYAFPILAERLLTKVDMSMTAIMENANLTDQILMSALNEKNMKLGDLKQYILRKTKNKEKDLVSYEYLSLYFTDEIFAIDLDLDKKFIVVKLTKPLRDIYSEAKNVKDLKSKLINNIKVLKVKDRYKEDIVNEVKKYTYIYVDMLRLNISAKDINRVDKTLRELIGNNSYYDIQQPIIARKELIADYLEILQNFNEENISQNNESIFQEVSPSNYSYDYIEQFIEDKIFNALDKIQVVNKNDYLDLIKLEIMTSENEFICQQYGKDIEKLLERIIR